MNRCYRSVNNWLIDVPSGSILHLTTGERKRLGEYQLKLLDILAKGAGNIFTREELTNLVWERRVIGNNSLPNAIHALRTALEDDGKAQRIIKTIPRKGYLLEAEYCCVVEKDEDEVNESDEEPQAAEPQAPVPPADNAEPAPGLAIMSEDVAPVNHPAPAVAAERRPRRIVAFLLVALLSAVMTASACWYLFDGSRDRLTAHEIQPGVYSNIRIYAIETTVEPAYMTANLYSKLKDSLYGLDQLLRLQSATMSIYFNSHNSSLSYSFMLSNACDKKQLAMTIYHWRTDTVQLNNLILRETRRKLNELATCKTK